MTRCSQMSLHCITTRCVTLYKGKFQLHFVLAKNCEQKKLKQWMHSTSYNNHDVIEISPKMHLDSLRWRIFMKQDPLCPRELLPNFKNGFTSTHCPPQCSQPRFHHSNCPVIVSCIWRRFSQVLIGPLRTIFGTLAFHRVGSYSWSSAPLLNPLPILRTWKHFIAIEWHFSVRTGYGCNRASIKNN